MEPAEHLLLRDGQPVALTPKTFDLLVFLVEHSGRLVTKDQILEAVWKDSFVEEANLTVSISALRKALGEKRGETQYIDTVPKKGYRFTADVAELAPPGVLAPADENGRRGMDGAAAATMSAATGQSQAGSDGLPATEALLPFADETRRVAPTEGEIDARTPRFRPALVILTVLVAVILGGLSYWRWRTPRVPVAAPPRQLAILPFQNLNHDAASQFLGFSLADAIINRLAYVSELTIRPSYAVLKYRNEIPDLPQVAKALSVDTLLTGSFIREGDNLRVSYQLVDAKTDRILRQGTVDLKYQNLLTIQDEVSEQVISGLALTLSPSEAAHLKNEPPVPPLAYEYYLRGVDLYSRNDFRMAIEMLQRSAEIYPGYALTWAHLGRTYTASASFQFGGEELYHKAQDAYEKALALQPALLSARIYMANLQTDVGRPEQAVPLLREALAVNPNLAEAHWELGYAYRYAGMLEDSIRECRRARELDPSVKLTSSAMNAYLYLGEYETFLRSLPPLNDSAFVEFYRGFALYHMHQFETSAEALDHAYELDPAMLQTQVGKAFSYHIRHQNDKGLALLNAAENKIQQRAVGDPEAIYKLANAYAELGDAASALRMFRHSVKAGFFPYAYFVRDPLMELIRQQPEFQKELQAARERSQDFKRRFF